MKKAILAIIFLVASIHAYSQIGFGFGSRGFGMGMRFPLNHNNARQRSRNIEDEVQRMKNDLALDSSQVVKVRGLLIERDRRRANGNPMSGQEYDQRMQGILDKDQYNKFAEIRQQRRQQRSPVSKDTIPKQPDQKKDLDDVYN